MDTHINHAYMRIRICIVNDQNEWTRTWAANSNELSRNGISAPSMNTKHSSYISECKAKLKPKYSKHDNWQSKGVKHRAPQQSPIYCSWANPTNPVFWNYEGITIAYVESRGSEDYLGPEMWLKLFEWKLDYWSLFENWSIWN